MDVFAHEPIGLEGFIVRVEVDIRRGIPGMDLVGLAAAAVRESRERVRAAVRNSGYDFPQDRMLINLSPADLPKEGAAYDLPIAMKILLEAGGLPNPGAAVFALGELTLDGLVKPVRAVLPGVLSARKNKIHFCIVPEDNYKEASMVDGVVILPISQLLELKDLLISIREGKAKRRQPLRPCTNKNQGGGFPLDFSDFKGNEPLLRAFEIAAVGRHNLLMFGPPGSGKTMAALRYGSFLPNLSEEDALVVRSLYSLVEFGCKEASAPLRPPFRSPHHSATLEGMIGGGNPLKPGEISLAHKGVLFLDETPEFRRDVLQSLREPSENGHVKITRAGRTVRFPSDFQLLMAANPCPCGNLGNPRKTCVCSAQEIQKYWKKLGGPLLDRIDMRIPVLPPKVAELLGENSNAQASMKSKIQAAIERQKERNLRFGFSVNNRIPPSLIPTICFLEEQARKEFDLSVRMLGISARACHSVLKIARTIADLNGSEPISKDDLLEALRYRKYGEGDNFWP